MENHTNPKYLMIFQKQFLAGKLLVKFTRNILYNTYTIIVSNYWICFGNIRNKIDYKNRNILITEGDFNLQLKR